MSSQVILTTKLQDPLNSNATNFFFFGGQSTQSGPDFCLVGNVGAGLTIDEWMTYLHFS